MGLVTTVDGVDYKVRRGKASTFLTYVDDSNATVNIQVHILQNINFSQAVAVPSRPTIKGDFRNQVTRRSAPSISFDLKLADRVSASLSLYKGSLFENKDLSTIDAEGAVKSTKYTYSSEWFVERLEYLKTTGTIVSLTTSSPLDDKLGDLIISNISYTHASNSREVVSCSITCTRAKFVNAAYTKASALDVLGLSVSSEDPDAPNVTPHTLDKVYNDGNIKYAASKQTFGDWFDNTGDLRRDIGKYIVSKLKDDPNQIVNRDFGLLITPSMYMESAVIDLTRSNRIHEYTCEADSTWRVDGETKRDGEPLEYSMRLIEIQIQTYFNNGSALDGNDRDGLKGIDSETHHELIVDDVVGGTQETLLNRNYDVFARHMNDVITTYNLDVNIRADTYVNKDDYENAVLGKTIDHLDPEFDDMTKPSSGNLVSGSFKSIWAERLSDKHQFEVKWRNPGDTIWNPLIKKHPISGGFDVYHSKLTVTPTFDLDLTSYSRGSDEEPLEDVVREARLRDNLYTDMHIFLWSHGDKMKFIVMDTNTFGSRPNSPRVFVSES